MSDPTPAATAGPESSAGPRSDVGSGSPGGPQPHADRRRGTTTILNYVLLLVVVALLVSGLLVGVSELVENQEERAVRSQLVTVGNRLADDLGTADRLVRTANTSADSSVRLHSSLPESVGASQYTISVSEISADGDRYRHRIVLRSVEPRVTTSVVFESATPVSGTVSGGDLVVEYVGGTLEVSDDRS